MHCSAAAVALSLLLAAAPVEAREDPASTAFARGKRFFEASDYLGAIAEFELAYKLRPNHAVQCTLARSYEKLNRFVEAVARYQRCLREGAQATAIAPRLQVSLREAQARITWVQVLSPGPGGTIHVDGLPRGATPSRLPIDPGTHAIEVRAGALVARTSLTTRGGEQHTISLVPLERATGSPVVVAPAPAPRRKKLPSAWFWASSGLTLALAGTAIALGAQTVSDRSAYEERPTEEGYDRFVSRRLLTNLFWGLAAAAAGTSTTLFFFTDFGGSPAPQERRVGLVLGGVF